MGRYRGQRCMVLDDLGDRLHIAYIGHDAFQAQELGYWQVDRGVYELVTPRDEVTDITEERSDYFPPRSDTGSMPAINTGTMRAISTGNMPAVNTGSMPAVTTGPVPAVGYRPPADGYGPAADLGAVTDRLRPGPGLLGPARLRRRLRAGPRVRRRPRARPRLPRGPGPRRRSASRRPRRAGLRPQPDKPEGLRLSGARRVLPVRRRPGGPAPVPGRPPGPARTAGAARLRARHRRVPGARREAASDAARPAPPGRPVAARRLAAHQPGLPARARGPGRGPALARRRWRRPRFRAATAASHSGPLDRGPAEAVPAGPGGRSPARPGDNASGPIGAHLSEPIGTRPGGRAQRRSRRAQRPSPGTARREHQRADGPPAR